MSALFKFLELGRSKKKKMDMLNKIKLTAGFVLIFFILGLVSCTKKSDETSDVNVNEAELEAVSSTDFTEKDEDLLSVDYREFYEKLAPHGEWIEVKENDIGVDLKKGTASGKNSSGHRSISIGELFGVKDAYADADFGAFFVWKPAPDLAVGITTVDQPDVVYQPYTNGQWVNTTNGWYFHAASEPEEITHHYGRWAHSPTLGWVWMPGRVWSPAWVDWRENDQYVAWTPVPPSIYVVNDVIVPPIVVQENYTVVERRYFVEPTVYKYMYKENKNKIMIKEWRRPGGVMVVNQTIVNRGPDVTLIQNVIGTTLPVISIIPVITPTQVSYTTTQYTVYQPQFKKVKTTVKINKTVSSPRGYVTYENAVVKNEVEKNSKGQEKSNEKAGDNSKDNKSGKDIKTPRIGDDSDMKNGNKNKGNNNDGNSKGNNNSGNDKQKDGKKNSKGNDDGNNTKGKDKPSKNDGNDKGKGNDNGGKDKGSKNDGGKGNNKGKK